MEIDDYDYIMSSICNAYFSGLNFDEVISCIEIATDKEAFDAAIEATIQLLEVVYHESK
jgi:hypothetical protein